MTARSTRLTRRQWTALALASPAVAQITSTKPPEGAPAPPQPPATPEERAQKAHADIRSTSDRLSKIELPMNLEPAFVFRALS